MLQHGYIVKNLTDTYGKTEIQIKTKPYQTKAWFIPWFMCEIKHRNNFKIISTTNITCISNLFQRLK